MTMEVKMANSNAISVHRRSKKLRASISMAFADTILSSSSSSLPLLRFSSPGFSVAPDLSPCESLLVSPICTKPPHLGIAFSRKRNFLHAAPDGVNAMSSTSLKAEQDSDSVPMPIVMIDQDSDPSATIVQVSFGDRLGALIDTMRALKDLGLVVTKGTVSTDGPVKQTKFFLTLLDTGRKVEDFDLLEMVRLTIINNLLKYHPESSEKLAMGEAFGIKGPEKKLDIDIATCITIKEDSPKRSLLYVETADRPGLLLEIIEVIADTNIDVESAEIDTEGLVAKDTFHVSYGGAALNSSMSQVLRNCLRYYLRRPEIDVDSY